MKDKSIYVKSYFRIEAGYEWGKGTDDDKYKLFTNEIRKLFIPLGFTIKEPDFSGACIEVWRGAENLYCHPRDLVGEIKKENIKEIENILKQGKTFAFRYVDIYDEAMNYTPDELKAELELYKAGIAKQILELFKTKRSNLYKSMSPLWDYRTDIKFFKNDLTLKNIERDFINFLFMELVKEGKIKEGENYKVGKIYRTITTNIGD